MNKKLFFIVFYCSFSSTYGADETNKKNEAGKINMVERFKKQATWTRQFTAGGFGNNAVLPDTNGLALYSLNRKIGEAVFRKHSSGECRIQKMAFLQSHSQNKPQFFNAFLQHAQKHGCRRVTYKHFMDDGDAIAINPLCGELQNYATANPSAVPGLAVEPGQGNCVVFPETTAG